MARIIYGSEVSLEIKEELKNEIDKLVQAGKRLPCPEAAEGGKIALVADGDTIKIDIPNGRINLDVPAKMLEARRKKLRPHDTDVGGWLLRYQNLVTSASTGAVLKKKF